MVYPYYQNHQSPAVPYPEDYDENCDHRGRRNPVLAASVAGVIAILVLAVGVLLGLQLTGPATSPQSPLPTSPAAVTAAAPTVPTIPSPEPAARDQERRQEAARLDRSTYESVSPREFALMAKDPDSWIDRKIVVYGVVTQFDSATGTTAFRANTGPSPMADPYDFDQNTFVTAHDSRMVSNVVEKDVVTMFVEVQGSYTYDTQIGGSTTVPSLLVNIIEPTRMSSPTPRLPSPQPAPAPAPVPLPDGDSVSGSQLQAIAATDQPVVASAAERWVPQLSSKRLGMVAEGRTWNNAAILAEHQQLRASYPGARLLWSGDWSTFSDSNFWITIAGTSFPTADGALAWCTGNGIDSDHCYAKLISTSHPVEGSTAYNR